MQGLRKMSVSIRAVTQHGVCTRCSRCLQPQTGEEDRGSRLRTEEPERNRQLYLFCRAAALERQGTTAQESSEEYGDAYDCVIIIRPGGRISIP